jgi:YD repeat-containing protein
VNSLNLEDNLERVAQAVEAWTYFAYDPDGNATYVQQPAGTTYFGYDGLDLLFERNAAGQITARRSFRWFSTLMNAACRVHPWRAFKNLCRSASVCRQDHENRALVLWACFEVRMSSFVLAGAVQFERPVGAPAQCRHRNCG